MHFIKYTTILTFFLLLSCSQDKIDTPKKTIVLRGGEADYSGSLIGYYANGEKKYEEDYTGGKKNGQYKHWFKNGEIKTIGQFKNNKRMGVWKWHSKDTKLIYAIDYKLYS